MFAEVLGTLLQCIPWCTYVVRCAIWYHLYDLTYVKNTHRGVLSLVKMQDLAEALAFIFTKSKTPLHVFFTFFKLYKWYQIVQRISYIDTTALFKNLLKIMKEDYVTLNYLLFKRFYIYRTRTKKVLHSQTLKAIIKSIRYMDDNWGKTQDSRNEKLKKSIKTSKIYNFKYFNIKVIGYDINFR